MVTKIPEWLTLCVWRALLGEIYPAIRAVAIAYSDDKALTIRYYLDREPIDFDFESVEVVSTNVGAMTGTSVITIIEVECQHQIAPIGKLDMLDGFVYCRREYEI